MSSSPFSSFDRYVVQDSLSSSPPPTSSAPSAPTHLVSNPSAPSVPRLDTRKIAGLHSVSLPNSVRDLNTARNEHGKAATMAGGSTIGVSLLSQLEVGRPKTHRPGQMQRGKQ
ncbi:hypothetical protein TrRE_jg7163, partial [Triparma retinervis]